MTHEIADIRIKMFETVGTDSLPAPYAEMYARMWLELLIHEDWSVEEVDLYCVTTFLCGH